MYTAEGGHGSESLQDRVFGDWHPRKCKNLFSLKWRYKLIHIIQNRLMLLGSHQNENSQLKKPNLSCSSPRIHPGFQGAMGPWLIKHCFNFKEKR